MVVDKEGRLLRVSVKTTQGLNKSGENYVVQLKNSGGASGKSIIRNFDNTSCDILFIVTRDNTIYEIPTSEINVKSALTLTHDWDSFIVNI